MEGLQRESVGMLESVGLAAVLSPLRRTMLEYLAKPDSASGLARRLGLARQKVNYHLRKLETAGLVEFAEEKARRGCTERYFRITARAFVINPEFLQGLAADPETIRDRYSSAYLVAMAARLIKDVAVLRQGAAESAQKLATLAVETEVSFASPADFNAFSEELASEILKLSAKYSRPDVAKSRSFRVFGGSHPVVKKTEADMIAAESP